MLRNLIRQFNSAIIAVVLAGVVWSVATSEANPSRELNYPEAIPVEFTNIPEGLVISQKLATSVRIKVRGPQARLDQLSPNSFKVQADLQGLGVGLHQVPIKWQIPDQILLLSAEPPTVGVRLEQLRTKTFGIRSDILDTIAPGFTANTPVVKPAQTTVSGAASLVDQVQDVVADVFLRGTKTSFERDVPLVARDSQGNPVQGVLINPQTVTVNVQIEQRVGYKDVSVRATLKGAPSSGYWVSNITVNPSTTTIVGSADALSKVAGFVETVPVDITGATSDVSKRTGVALPDGATVLDNEGVTVQVSVTPLMGGQSVRRKVDVQGLRRGQTATVSPEQVDVILSGPLPTLQNLAPEDVLVTVDVAGMGAGAFQLRPRVPTVPDSLRLQSIVPDSVQVTIVEAPTSVPTFTVTPSATRTLSSTLPIEIITTTPTITRTRTLTATPPAILLPPPTTGR